MSALISSLFVPIVLAISAQAQITESDIVKHGSFKESQFKKAPKRVYINSFNVYFQVFGSARASTSGGEMLGTLRGNTNVAMGVFLDSIDTKDFIELATKVYEEYAQKLRDNGFDIVSPDEAAKTSTLKDWVRKEGGDINSAQSLGFAKVTPRGYTYFIKRETNKGKERTGMFANTGSLSKDLDDAIIADVNMTFYFVQMKTYDSELLGYAQVTGKPNFHFARLLGDTKNQVLTSTNYAYGKNLTAPNAAINTTLKKAVYSPEPVFEKGMKFKESAVAASKSIPDYASVVFVRNTNMNASHYLPCDPELYKKETYRMMTEFLDIGLKRLLAGTGKK